MNAKPITFTRDGIMQASAGFGGPRVDGSKIRVFHNKKTAVAYAKSIRFPVGGVVPVQTRFQLGYTLYCRIRGYLARDPETLLV